MILEDFSLRYLQVFVTLRCERSCNFCFSGRLPWSVGDMPLEDFERLLGIAADLGVGSVDLLGGEPTLHPQFLGMLEAANREGLRTSFSTNGANVNVLYRACDWFSRDAVQPGVSLNDERVNEALHEYIMNMKPVLKSVCTNKRQVPRSARPYLDVPGISYYLLFMDAVDSRHLMKCVSFPAYLETLHSLADVHRNVKGVHCGFLGEKPRCPGGTTKLTVLPDGSVFPCYLLARYGRYRVGNIRTDSFSRIWDSPILRTFRYVSENPCRKTQCRIHGTCKGGCPAMSLLFGGSPDAPDPRCDVDSRSVEVSPDEDMSR